METETEFTGVFMFTNPTKQDRKYLWNNKEYVFPAESTAPLIIPSETLDNIQEIRKRFAYRMAEERLYEGEITPSKYNYKKAKEMGGGMPPTFDPKILEPWIEECLKPLPIKRATVKEGKKLDEERNYKSTKAVGQNADLADVFREENQNIPTLGAMSDR